MNDGVNYIFENDKELSSLINNVVDSLYVDRRKKNKKIIKKLNKINNQVIQTNTKLDSISEKKIINGF